MPKYYYVKRDNLVEEKAKPGSTQRLPSSEGSRASNVFLWGQAMLIMADLLTSRIISTLDLDPICRHLPPHMRAQSGNRTNFEVTTYFSPPGVKILWLQISWNLCTNVWSKFSGVNLTLNNFTETWQIKGKKKVLVSLRNGFSFGGYEELTMIFLENFQGVILLSC